MAKVKSIFIKMNVSGKGIVNYDGDNQKAQYNKMNPENSVQYDNNKFAKKNYYVDQFLDMYGRIKISSECLRYYIFQNDFQFQCPNVMHTDRLLMAAMANPAAIIRGYMYIDGKFCTRNKSALCLPGSEQTNNAIPTLEFCSNSGKKNTDEEKIKHDISIYNKETCGEITYQTEGVIDLKELQFLSLSQIFDRLALNPDLFPLYNVFLQTTMPTFNSEPKYYLLKSSHINIPEYGIHFSNDDIVFMVKELLTKILEMQIIKATAYAMTSGLQIKFVYDCTKDLIKDDSGWVDVDSDFINRLEFEAEDFYVEKNKEESEAILKQIEEAEAIIKQRNKEERDQKRAEARDKKKRAKMLTLEPETAENTIPDETTATEE